MLPSYIENMWKNVYTCTKPKYLHKVKVENYVFSKVSKVRKYISFFILQICYCIFRDFRLKSIADVV